MLTDAPDYKRDVAYQETVSHVAVPPIYVVYGPAGRPSV